MTNKIAVITGASRGVGKSIAEHLAQLGYHVNLLARDQNALKQACDDITSKGGRAEYFSVDITNVEAVRSCIESIITKHHRIDFLFNNAGIVKVGTSEITDADVDQLLKVNLSGAIYVAKYVATQMKKQKDGYIINVSSRLGKVPSALAGIYAASKYGLCGFSESLSEEMSLFGVKVTNICPALIATDMTKGRTFNQEDMLQLEDIKVTVDYLLKLSKNALPTEVRINCVPFMARTIEAGNKTYGLT